MCTCETRNLTGPVCGEPSGIMWSRLKVVHRCRLRQSGVLMSHDSPMDNRGRAREARGIMRAVIHAHVFQIVTLILVGALVPAGATLRADTSAREALARIRPVVERSVVMVKVEAFPQVRVRGVIQPPRQFDLEGPATVIGSGVIASSLSIFDPVKSLPQREGVEFSTTVYSKIEVMLEDGSSFAGRAAGTAEAEDLIFFAPESTDDAARLPALAMVADPQVEVFGEYLDVTRAPAAFGRCAIARVSMVSGWEPSGAFVFVTSQSAGSPVVDATGAMLGLGVRVGAHGGMPATSVLLPAARVLEAARACGVLAESGGAAAAP